MLGNTLGVNIDHTCIWLFGVAYASSVNDVSPNLREMVLPKWNSERFASLAMSLEGAFFFRLLNGTAGKSSQRDQADAAWFESSCRSIYSRMDKSPTE